MPENLIITVDGQCGSGKSISSEYLAAKLGIKYLDTGIFYRAVTLFVLKNKIKPNDFHSIVKAAKNLEIKLTENKVLVNGEDYGGELRSLEVTNKVSNISRIGALRRILNEKIREEAKGQGFLAEGKDAGAVIFPEAKYKFFLESNIKARIARRHQEFLDNGQKISVDKIEKEIKLRDSIENSKNPGILRKAEDSIVLNTTYMIVEEQINYLYKAITDPEFFAVMNKEKETKKEI